MTRAERLMELTAKLHVLDEVHRVARLSPLDEEHRAMLRREHDELRRQMGGSDRRKFERLLAAWRT